jgi:magnesium and cobalt transporter
MNEEDKPPSRYSPLDSLPERVRKALRVYPKNRQQLVELLREEESRNLIDPETLAILEGALGVSEMQVRDIMVPRAQMVTVEDDADPKEFLPTIIESGYSRFPVIDAKRDQVVGILLAKDLLGYLAQENGRPFDIKDVLRPPVFVPESKRLNILLREFKNSRNHLAIVVDEYGGVAGLVSIEDVIEQIVGDISDEYDVGEEEYIRKHRDNRYIVKARTPIEEFNAYFQTEFEEEDYDTVGGLVLKAFGHLPKRGETIALGGFEFTVLRADRRRVHLLRLSKLPPQSEEQEAPLRRAHAR